MVLLIREPHNPYDRWAIRVDNARNEKVGHIPRTVVMRISPLIDSGKLVIEGTIPYGENNMYSIPLILYCYGSIDHLDDVSSAVNMAGCRFEEEAPCFAPRSLWHPSSPLSLFALSPSSSPLRMRSTPSRGPIKEGQGRSSAPSYSSARRLSASEVAKRVTTMLDNLMKDEGSRPMAEASEVVKTDLYLHQKEALAWMIAKEKPSEDDDLPVFWERRNDEYLHTLCNFSQKDRPETIGGGILADGKCILVATRFDNVLALLSLFCCCRGHWRIRQRSIVDLTCERISLGSTFREVPTSGLLLMLNS